MDVTVVLLPTNQSIIPDIIPFMMIFQAVSQPIPDPHRKRRNLE